MFAIFPRQRCFAANGGALLPSILLCPSQIRRFFPFFLLGVPSFHSPLKAFVPACLFFAFEKSHGLVNGADGFEQQLIQNATLLFLAGPFSHFYFFFSLKTFGWALPTSAAFRGEFEPPANAQDRGHPVPACFHHKWPRRLVIIPSFDGALSCLFLFSLMLPAHGLSRDVISTATPPNWKRLRPPSSPSPPPPIFPILDRTRLSGFERLTRLFCGDSTFPLCLPWGYQGLGPQRLNPLRRDHQSFVE